MKIINFFSPNYDKKKRVVNSIQIIVFHYTGMQSQGEAIVRLCNPKSKVSSHLLISENGKVFKKNDFVSFEPGSQHSSYTKNGCLVLVFMRGINKAI